MANDKKSNSSGSVAMTKSRLLPPVRGGLFVPRLTSLLLKGQPQQQVHCAITQLGVHLEFLCPAEVHLDAVSVLSEFHTLVESRYTDPDNICHSSLRSRRAQPTNN